MSASWSETGLPTRQPIADFSLAIAGHFPAERAMLLGANATGSAGLRADVDLLADVNLSLEQSELLEQRNAFAVAWRYYPEVPPPEAIEAVLAYGVVLRAAVLTRLDTTLEP